MTEKTKILVAVPLFHAYGWDLGFLPTLKLGSTMFLEEEISARRIGKLVREHEVDVLPGTPSMYAELSKLPTAKKLEVKKPRYLAAGSRLDQTVADEFFDKYGIRLLQLLPLDRGRDGRARGHRQVSDHGRQADRGVEVRSPRPTARPTGAKDGLIWVKSKTLSPKSIGPFDDENDQPAARASRHGRDRRDRQGRLAAHRRPRQARQERPPRQLTGREDDVVKVDGKRVALGEVEGCLEAFPKIKAAQATVVTDPMAGAMVVARVVMKQKCGAEEIIDHCARNLAPYKVPRRIEFCESIN